MLESVQTALCFGGQNTALVFWQAVKQKKNTLIVVCSHEIEEGRNPESNLCEHTVSVGFRQRTLEEIREELRKMTDEELLKHGKSLRELSRPDPLGQVYEPWAIQLKEARKEWKRRHPQ